MEGPQTMSSNKSSLNKSNNNHKNNLKKSKITKFISFCRNLFGKKTKESFLSVISHLLEEYKTEGLINAEEQKMFKNIISFGDKKAYSIMIPRTDIVAIKHDASLEDAKKLIVSQGYSRMPVFKENFDEIIGFIHSKDLAKFLCDEDQDFAVAKITRKILFIPGSMELLDVLRRMRMAQTHAAIVLDEFGGVDGFVTIENIMEEIVGDIEDEHDLPSDSSVFRIRKINDKNYQFGGRVEIEKIEELLQIKIRDDDEDFQTIGGLAMTLFRRVPSAGEEIKTNNINLKIIDADGRSVKLVEVAITN